MTIEWSGTLPITAIMCGMVSETADAEMHDVHGNKRRRCRAIPAGNQSNCARASKDSLPGVERTLLAAANT